MNAVCYFKKWVQMKRFEIDNFFYLTETAVKLFFLSFSHLGKSVLNLKYHYSHIQMKYLATVAFSVAMLIKTQ